METLDLSRRGVLLNDEQLGPYPLEKLKRVERLTVDIVEDSPRVDEKEMAFAKCRLGGFGDVLKKRMEDFTVRVPIGASYYHFQKYLNDYPENEVAPEKAPLPEDTRILRQGRFLRRDLVFRVVVKVLLKVVIGRPNGHANRKILHPLLKYIPEAPQAALGECHLLLIHPG